MIAPSHAKRTSSSVSAFPQKSTLLRATCILEPRTQALTATGSATVGIRTLPDGRRSGGDEGLGSRLPRTRPIRTTVRWLLGDDAAIQVSYAININRPCVHSISPLLPLPQKEFSLVRKCLHMAWRSKSRY